MNPASLKPELDFYVANRTNLAARYAGKFLVIKGQKVIRVYERELTAICETQKEHEPGTFLVQEANASVGSYSEPEHAFRNT